jgi:hypothetical protein
MSDIEELEEVDDNNSIDDSCYYRSRIQKLQPKLSNESFAT